MILLLDLKEIKIGRVIFHILKKEKRKKILTSSRSKNTIFEIQNYINLWIIPYQKQMFSFTEIDELEQAENS